jgi:hypothetical protein
MWEVLAGWCTYCHDRFFPNGSAAVMTASCPLPAIFWFAPGTVLFAVGLQLQCGLCGFLYRM